MAVHVAILKRPYLNAILAGVKTVESRLSRNAIAPYDALEPGERIYLKASAGPFMALARAGGVHHLPLNSPGDLQQLRDRFDRAIAAEPDYWHAKRHARFAAVIELASVEPIDVGPAYPRSPYRAWFVLDERADPLCEIALSAGALRNSYLIVPRTYLGPDAAALELELPDGQRTATHQLPNGRLHWRGWKRYYERAGLTPGCRVRLLRVGAGRYRVDFPSAASDAASGAGLEPHHA